MLRYLNFKTARGRVFAAMGGLLVCVLSTACVPIEEPAEPAPAAKSAEAAVPAAETKQAPAATAVSNDSLKMNQAGLDIIKKSEGLRLEAYQSNGRWYIGYGHAATAKPGMKISEAEAEKLLRGDVAVCEREVAKSIPVPLNENQFSALVSLCYNLGTGGFRKTSVYAALQEGDYQKAADVFPNHARARVGGELKVIPHLLKRREEEKALFLKPA